MPLSMEGKKGILVFFEDIFKVLRDSISTVPAPLSSALELPLGWHPNPWSLIAVMASASLHSSSYNLQEGKVIAPNNSSTETATEGLSSWYQFSETLPPPPALVSCA